MKVKIDVDVDGLDYLIRVINNHLEAHYEALECAINDNEKQKCKNKALILKDLIKQLRRQHGQVKASD